MKVQRGRARLTLETLERRDLLSADPLPVLLVIADQRDFYYQEYSHTRLGLENAGVAVAVAATTTNPSTAHPNSGQGSGVAGIVQPDIALADVDPADYSAIVFVGGWGASMYQYAFDAGGANFYQDSHYNGSAATKQIVNDLINAFLADDKYAAAVCHGVTVLAWARVDGVSPLDGKQVSIPYIGTPAMTFNGASYPALYPQGQYDQVVANGALPNLVSGQYGNPATVADDVVVDGRIITAENFDSALAFGGVIAQQVIAAANAVPANQPPSISDQSFNLAENSAAGTVVGSVIASDPDAGQSLTFAIIGGNPNNTFAINAATGAMTVANPGMLDFETTPNFQLTVQVSDNGNPALSATATVTVQLQDVAEPPAAAAQIVVTQQPSNVMAAHPIVAVVRLLDQLGGIVSEAGVAVTATLESGSGVLLGTLTRFTDAHGIATFDDMGIHAAGVKTLRFTSGAFSVVSNAFKVTPAGATALRFVKQPTDVRVGRVMAPVVVQLQDMFGNAVARKDVVVSVTLVSGGVKMVYKVRTNAAGRAVFNTLKPVRPGAGMLVARVPGMAPVASAGFVVLRTPMPQIG